uniref:Cytokinin biosynthetic isopentenyltransferase n=1 Tax=Solanum tuberosum TaxID=4113 RepID=M1DSI3_SOLTU
MGATGTEKSRLSVDLATHFRGEIFNSDKMQVFKGLKIVTNKNTQAEKQGVRHYFLVIVGGSNSYIEKFVEDHAFLFKYKYDRCFIWIDIEQSILNRRVYTRVDEMVNADADYTKGIRRSIGVREMAKYLREEKNIDGDDESKKMILPASISSIKRLVDEVRQIFIPDADYTKGIRRSIGVRDMDKYLREEKNIDGDDESKKMIFQASISSIKRNTRILICNQLDKIQRLINGKMWPVHHIIATDIFKEY